MEHMYEFLVILNESVVPSLNAVCRTFSYTRAVLM